MILRLQGISKRYVRSGGERRIAVDDVSLELGRGQMTGIFGPSGAGKTTLLRIAAGLQAPDAGEVFYDGEPMRGMSAAERVRLRRREIACVWSGQEVQERLSVLDHVALPLLVDRRDRRGAERRAREALLVCEADSCLGMEMQELSDGESQRVAIARALVTEPRLLLADGPASRLSMFEQETILGLLASLAREAKVAVLITGSDADALVRANPLLYMCDGKLVNADPLGQHGRVYQFPPARRREAIDA